MTVTETTDTRTGTCAGPPRGGRRPDGKDKYTISEVAALTGLTAHTLRWYERIGLMPHVDRSHTGQRRYTDRDLDWLALVGKLRLTGMPVADMVRYAELVRAGDHTYAERFELLEATREDVLARIAELQGTLAVLDRKISFYADAGRAPAPEGPEDRAPGDDDAGGRGEPRGRPRRTRPRGTGQSSASNSAFFEENSSSVTSPA